MTGDAKPPVDQVFVATTSRAAMVKVEGRGSFKVSASLKEFGDSAIRKQFPLLLLDMQACVGMDSTFMGVLAGVASRLRTQSGKVAMVNCSPRIRGLLATLGLDQLITAYEAGAAPEEYTGVLQGRAPREKLEDGTCHDVETVRTMLDAHQHLVELVPENLPQFKDVLQFLREEVQRKSTEQQGRE